MASGKNPPVDHLGNETCEFTRDLPFQPRRHVKVRETHERKTLTARTFGKNLGNRRASKKRGRRFL
jgi:hypothetical protein